MSPPSGQIPLFNVVPATGHSYSWMTYGGDDKLRDAQRTTYEATGNRTVFTEYRYDALGTRGPTRALR